MELMCPACYQTTLVQVRKQKKPRPRPEKGEEWKERILRFDQPIYVAHCQWVCPKCGYIEIHLKGKLCQ